MTARLRVLYLLDMLRPGVGVPETLRLLIGPCRDAGIDLHVASLHREPGDLGDEIVRSGVRVLDLAARFPKTERRLLRLIPYVLRHRIRVVHANEFRSIYLALRLKQIHPSLRVVGHLRVTGNLDSEEGRRARWFARHAPRLFEVVAVSQAVLDDFRATTGLETSGRVIWNGRPLERFARVRTAAERHALRHRLEVADDAAVLVCAASLQATKDHPTLLRALVRLRASGRPFVLLLAGEGPARAELEALVQTLDLVGCVRFLGRREDIPDLLAAADLYVGTSLREGLPGSAIEAQASGLPVVFTRCGGPEEVVVDGVTGLLAPPGDDAAVGEALGRLLADADLRAQMAAAARENARRFDLGRMVEQWAALYRAAAAR